MLSSLVARIRSLWTAVRSRAVVEAEMSAEFRTHIELRANDLEKTGLSREAALKQARAEFGIVQRYKHEAREARGLKRIDGFRMSWLDFKLGLRMLVRYPGLTVVGGMAMAFSIAIGCASFELITQWVNPTLPLNEGQRIVGVQLLDAATLKVDARALRDFADWRMQAKSIVEISAFRKSKRNLSAGDGSATPIDAAAMTASAFTVARVRPLLGRVLMESDEQRDSPQVVILSFTTWQQAFRGDASVIGRTAWIDGVPHAVIGVMPKKFAFPVAQDVWTPLRLNPIEYARREGPGIVVFGRLAPGSSIDDAQRELQFLGRRASTDFPATHKNLLPQVGTYANTISPVPRAEALGLHGLMGFVVLLVVLVCCNVALLMFARAATRESEIVVRNALGASRGRIVAQLFAEALVLGSLGAVVGLGFAWLGVQLGLKFIALNVGRLPFWYRGDLSTRTLLYAFGLVILAAVIAGVLPGLKVTRNLGARLQQATNGGGGIRFGRLWTAVIVAQVAVTVAFPAGVFLVERTIAKIERADLGIRAAEYMTAKLEYDGDSDDFIRMARALEQGLLADSAVIDVTFVNPLPSMYHQQLDVAAMEDVPAPKDSVVDRTVNSATVDVDYLNVIGAGVHAGRNFTISDASGESRVVVVNESFVTRILKGRNAIGRQIRFMDYDTDGLLRPGIWHEIIGVTKDLGMNYLGKTDGNAAAGVYFPMNQMQTSVRVAIHTRGDPTALGARIPSLVYATNPSVRASDVVALNEITSGGTRILSAFLKVAIFISGMALLLSLAGIYAALSFAVSRRTREIGIRMALGAGVRGIIFAVLRPPLIQVSIGVTVGAWLVATIAAKFVGALSPREIALVVGYAIFMTAVCMLACVVPARRALAVEPTEALRAEV